MQITMKELPLSEKPYEKCLAFGTEKLSDAELLAVIIRTGTRGRNAIDLANQILNVSKTSEGILNLTHLTIQELLRVKGIGKVKAVQLKCIAELSKRIVKATVKKGMVFTLPSDIAEYYMEDMRHKEREELLLIMMNSKNKLLQDMILSRGTVNSSLVSPREIFVEALKYGAVSIALVHNHPSGDPTPSKEDIFITKRIREVADLVGIPLIDHIIIGDNKYISMKVRGIL